MSQLVWNWGKQRWKLLRYLRFVFVFNPILKFINSGNMWNFQHPRYRINVLKLISTTLDSEDILLNYNTRET